MRKRTVLWLFAILCPLGLVAQSFTFNYRGVDFKCKVKGGKTIIYGFDKEAAKVVIPSQVVDKKGATRQVSTLSLYGETRVYHTNAIAIETGITEIDEYCFYQFNKLAVIYIPNTIEKIGKKAFNAKHAPEFNMPSNINASDLVAGNTVYPKAVLGQEADPLAGLDLSAYGKTTNEDTDNEVAEVPKSKGITPGTSDIDYNIPTTNANRENTFCVIIANEKYAKKDTPDVRYATQDGKTFQDYCLRTLGLPKENIKLVLNASFLGMRDVLGWLQQIGEAYGNDASFIFYYAGHGVPDEEGNCKLIPTDVSINDVNNGFSLKRLYESLGKITANSALVLIDACFSGNDRNDVAAIDDTHRGIVREVKTENVTGNVVALTATSNTETALAYDEKAHGLFSYYLMKKLQDTKGNVTYGELYDYIKKEVMRRSVVSKGKRQTPSVIPSSKIEKNWKNIKL